MLNESTALQQMNTAAASLPPYPADRFQGRGIVIPGGGVKYFPSAWVCIHMLRHVGCTLPIELWHLGPEEMSDEMKSLVEPLGVTCVDALEVRKQYPVRTVGKANGGHEGWELKPYSILHSRFREVLFFDADNMPVVDPTFLFDTPQYQKCGSIFWPDPFYFAPQDKIWELTGVPYRHEPQFESGQILVDKERCWGPLKLAMWMNEHSDFWYRHMYGDKDTFHMAWRKLGVEYVTPAKTYEHIQGVMCHHDFRGRRIFQHRHGHKWSTQHINPEIPGLLLASECSRAIATLCNSWTTFPLRPYVDRRASLAFQQQARMLCGCEWVLIGSHKSMQPVRFTIDGACHGILNDIPHLWRFDVQDDAMELMLIHPSGQPSSYKAKGMTPFGPQEWVATRPNGTHRLAMSKASRRAYPAMEIMERIVDNFWACVGWGPTDRTARLFADGRLYFPEVIDGGYWTLDVETASIHFHDSDGVKVYLNADKCGAYDGWHLRPPYQRMALVPSGLITAPTES